MDFDLKDLADGMISSQPGGILQSIKYRSHKIERGIDWVMKNCLYSMIDSVVEFLQCAHQILAIRIQPP